MNTKPNILIFLVDQMRSDMTLEDSPCIMPTVNRLAREGVAFTQTYTPSPHCCPSRATFMTGQYPTRHGVWNNVNTITAHQYGLYPGIRTYAHELSRAGYTTSYAGKVHVSNAHATGDLGWKVAPDGSDEIYQFHNRDLPFAPDSETREFGKIHRYGWGDIPVFGKAIIGKDQIQRASWYAAGVAPGIAGLRKLLQQDDPWCLCISTDMDWANPVPEELLDLYNPDELRIPESFYADTMVDKPRAYARYRRMYADQLTEEEIRRALAGYYALCTLQDRYLQMVLEVLDASSQKDNTIVLFVGDHGDYVFEHGLINMGFPAFREAYHVPAIMRWPAGIRNPGRRVDALVSLVDFAPTFCELGCANMPAEHVAGHSLTPFLEDRPPDDWRKAVIHMTNGNETYFTQRIIMTEKWRYVMNWFDYDELYDLENDPRQTRNLLYDAYQQPVKRVQPGEPVPGPWPYLPPDLEQVRRNLITEYWNFAIDEQDMTFSSYFISALSAYGPLVTGRSCSRIRSREIELGEAQVKGVLR